MLACSYTVENHSVLLNFNSEILVYRGGCALTVHTHVSLAKRSVHDLFRYFEYT